MSATTGERTENLTDVLREYAGKLTELNREMQQVLIGAAAMPRDPGRLAWLLDRAKRFDRPMREFVNVAARRLEHVWVDDDNSVGVGELTLRLGETEAQLHHMLRQAGELQKFVDELKLTEHVARLRESAGLNAMKGGPLRPAS